MRQVTSVNYYKR